jgi:hypothetical protein
LIDIKLVEQEMPHRWASVHGIGKRIGFDPSTVRKTMDHLVKTTTLVLLLLVPGNHARAAKNEPNVVTLSCDGMLTATYGANTPEASQPLQRTGLVVNLDEQTVFFVGYVVPIEGVGEGNIKFGGTETVDYGFRVAIIGNMDRATGRMDATMVMSDPTQQPSDPNIATIHYEVICKPSSN